MIDLGHGVPPQDVRTGARRLARAMPFTPAGRPPGGRRSGRRRLAAGGGAADRRPAPRRARQRPARARRRALRRRGRGVDVGESPLAAAAGLGHVPRPRHLRPGGGAPRRRATPLDRGGGRDRPGDARAAARILAPAARGIVHVVEVDGFGNLITDGVAAGGGRGSGSAGTTSCVGRTFGDVPAGALVLYDGLGGRSRAGRQRRQRGGAAGCASGRRLNWSLCCEPRRTARASRDDRVDQRARARAGRRGRRARDAGHRGRADAGRGRQGRAWVDAAGRGDRRVAGPARVRRPAAAARRARGGRRRGRRTRW